MGLLEQYAETQNPDFIKKVQIAMVKTASNVYSESAAVANHVDRARFATKVIANPVGYAERCAPTIVADGATTNASTDTAIETRISALWDAFSEAGLVSGSGPPSVFMVPLIANALTYTNAPAGGLEVLTGGGSRVKVDLRNVERVVGEVVTSVIPHATGTVRFEYSLNDGGSWDPLLDMLTGGYSVDGLKVSAPGTIPAAAKTSSTLLRVVVTGDGVVDPVVQRACLSFQAA